VTKKHMKLSTTERSTHGRTVFSQFSSPSSNEILLAVLIRSMVKLSGTNSSTTRVFGVETSTASTACPALILIGTAIAVAAPERFD
jgi:hypothetical protein